MRVRAWVCRPDGASSGRQSNRLFSLFRAIVVAAVAERPPFSFGVSSLLGRYTKWTSTRVSTSLCPCANKEEEEEGGVMRGYADAKLTYALCAPPP